MTGFNLPPGCNVSDIPGNRPEDLADEAWWDALGKRIDPALMQMIDENEDLQRLIETVRDMAYGAGYDEGQADAALAATLDHES